jgi:hypothetical protein
MGTAAVSLALGSLSGIPSSSAQVPKLAASATSIRSANGASPASELKAIAAEAQKESKATFKLTYTTSGSGSAQAITLEQKPPDQLFKSGSSEVIYNGKTTYYCTTSGKTTQCQTFGSIGESPLAAIVGVYSASTYITIMQTWQTIVSMAIPGFKISFTNATFAGLASKCVSWSYQGSNAKYCVADIGVLAYVGGAGKGSSTSTFALTGYSSHVSGSDFSLPKGAKLTAG